MVDLETDRLEPLTGSRAIEAIKLIDSLYDQGVGGGAPGAPVDVPPSLRGMISCAASGHYLTDRSTLDEHRQIFWTPSLFDYSLFSASRRETEMIQRPKEICRKKIQELEYRLEEGKRRELEEIYNEARRNLC